jgi:hypothetical protein
LTHTSPGGPTTGLQGRLVRRPAQFGFDQHQVQQRVQIHGGKPGAEAGRHPAVLVLDLRTERKLRAAFAWSASVMCDGREGPSS